MSAPGKRARANSRVCTMVRHLATRCEYWADQAQQADAAGADSTVQRFVAQQKSEQAFALVRQHAAGNGGTA